MCDVGAFTPNTEKYMNEAGNVRVEKPFDIAVFKEIVEELILAAKAKHH